MPRGSPTPVFSHLLTEAREAEHRSASVAATEEVRPLSVGALERPVPARLEVVSADPRLALQRVAPGTITLVGRLPDAGPFDAVLALKVEDHFLTIELHKGMEPEDVGHALRAALPPGLEASVEQAEDPLLLVTFWRPQNSGGTPKVALHSSDPRQTIRWVAPNVFVITGRAARSLSIRSELEVSIAGKRLTLPINSGDPPLRTAQRLRDALPLPLTALIDMPQVSGGEVSVTILRQHG